jgi:hypothetical protein
MTLHDHEQLNYLNLYELFTKLPLALLLGLYHILLDHYDYLMMQSCLWQMVRTRTTDDDMLDIPEGSAPHGRGRGQPSHGNAPPPPPHPPVSLEQLLV